MLVINNIVCDNLKVDTRKFPYQLTEYVNGGEIYSFVKPFLKYNQKYGEDYIVKKNNIEKDRYAVFTKGENIVVE